MGGLISVHLKLLQLLSQQRIVTRWVWETPITLGSEVLMLKLRRGRAARQEAQKERVSTF